MFIKLILRYRKLCRGIQSSAAGDEHRHRDCQAPPAGVDSSAKALYKEMKQKVGAERTRADEIYPILPIVSSLTRGWGMPSFVPISVRVAALGCFDLDALCVSRKIPSYEGRQFQLMVACSF